MRLWSWIAVVAFLLPLGTAFALPVELEWKRTYNSPGNGEDRGTGFALDSAANIYVAGYSDRSDIGHDFDIWLRKYDSNGTLLWMQTYNNPNNGEDRTNRLDVDPFGDIYVTGYEVRDDLGQGRNMWLRKYDSDGNTLWTRTHNGADDRRDVGAAVAFDADGNVYVSGSEVTIGERENIWLRKYDPDGNALWTRTVNGPVNYEDRGEGVATDSLGNVYQAAWYQESKAQRRDHWLRKYDSDGNVIWTRTYNSPGNGDDRCGDVTIDLLGNVYLTANEDRQDLGQDLNAFVRKYDAAGNVLWTRTYDGPSHGHDTASWAALGPTGNLWVVGHEDRSDLGEFYNLWACEYTPDGTILQTITYNSPGNFVDSGRDIAVDLTGSVYIVGIEHRQDLGEHYNMVLLKYSPIPEPCTLVLLSAGLAGLARRGRRRS